MARANISVGTPSIFKPLIPTLKKKQWRKIVMHQTMVRVPKNPSFHPSFLHSLVLHYLFEIPRFVFRIVAFVFLFLLFLACWAQCELTSERDPKLEKLMCDNFSLLFFFSKHYYISGRLQNELSIVFYPDSHNYFHVFRNRTSLLACFQKFGECIRDIC